jgi:hypothetical protein
METPDDRKTRLAAALRANLRRRKAHGRPSERVDPSVEGSETEDSAERD